MENPFSPMRKAVGGFVALRKGILWQYLPSKVLVRKQLGMVKILQPLFVSSAWLKSWMSLNPKPSNFLDNSKHVIAKNGIADRTNCSIVALPTVERKERSSLLPNCNF